MPPPAREKLFTVAGAGADGAPAVAYEGPDRQTAEKVRVQQIGLGKMAGVVLTSRTEYPPPERNPLCKCKGMPAQQNICPFGHYTVCHWPLACDEARCGRDQTDQTALWLASRVLETDSLFNAEPGRGEVETCSRCGAEIKVYPVRLWEAGLARGRYRRYHPGCLGLPTPEDLRGD
jgi:hypothetical protein